MKYLSALSILMFLISCRSPATGPVKGVLVVYGSGVDYSLVDELLEDIQIHVITVDTENVFNFSSCTEEMFKGDLRNRRTILFVAEQEDRLPDVLQRIDGIYQADDVWATGQNVFGIIQSEFTQLAELSRLLERSYNEHLSAYIYGSFVSTQMSSPERIDSLLTLGFSMDIPKSYQLSDWDPDAGFLQYQRTVSDECLLLLSIRWIDDDIVLDPDEAVLWRETVARHYFYNAAADSVDRSRVVVDQYELHGLRGWKLLGMWRNPDHLNAGAFTSYILHADGCRYLLDMEIFHEHREKEPYVREGWIIMNTFFAGG